MMNVFQSAIFKLILFIFIKAEFSISKLKQPAAAKGTTSNWNTIVASWRLFLSHFVGWLTKKSQLKICGRPFFVSHLFFISTKAWKTIALQNKIRGNNVVTMKPLAKKSVEKRNSNVFCLEQSHLIHRRTYSRIVFFVVFYCFSPDFDQISSFAQLNVLYFCKRIFSRIVWIRWITTEKATTEIKFKILQKRSLSF